MNAWMHVQSEGDPTRSDAAVHLEPTVLLAGEAFFPTSFRGEATRLLASMAMGIAGEVEA